MGKLDGARRLGVPGFLVWVEVLLVHTHNTLYLLEPSGVVSIRLKLSEVCSDLVNCTVLICTQVTVCFSLGGTWQCTG